MPLATKDIPSEAVGFFAVVSRNPDYWYGAFLERNYDRLAESFIEEMPAPARAELDAPNGEELLYDLMCNHLVEGVEQYLEHDDLPPFSQRMQTILRQIRNTSAMLAWMCNQPFFMIYIDEKGVGRLLRLKADSIADARDEVLKHPEVQSIERTLRTMQHFGNATRH